MFGGGITSRRTVFVLEIVTEEGCDKTGEDSAKEEAFADLMIGAIGETREVRILASGEGSDVSIYIVVFGDATV